MSNLVTGYHYDSDTLFYDKELLVQKINGITNYPKNTLKTKPLFREGYWYKCLDGKSWTEIKKPTNCKEAVEANLTAIANSPKDHDREVITLLQSFVNSEADKYRLKTDPNTLELSIEEIPEPTFEEVKAEKIQELSNIAGQYDQYKCPVDMYIVSSTGFKVDADIRSQTNMQSLAQMLNDNQTTQYKDFNNEKQTVTKEQLLIMLGESKQNGLNLYSQKFAYQDTIESCKTIEELNALKFEFKMLDFTK